MPPCVCPTCEGALVDPDTHDCPALYRSLGCNHPHPAPPPNAGRLLCALPPRHTGDHTARGHAWSNPNTEVERLRWALEAETLRADMAEHNRDEARALAQRCHDDWHAAKTEFGQTAARLTRERDEARASLQALRSAVGALRDATTTSHTQPWDRDLAEAKTRAMHGLLALLPSPPLARYVVRGEFGGKSCWYESDDPDGPGGLWVERLDLAHAMLWSEAEAKGKALDEATRGKPGWVRVVAVEHRAEETGR